jgi:hypothetical protein
MRSASSKPPASTAAETYSTAHFEALDDFLKKHCGGIAQCSKAVKPQNTLVAL